MTYVGIDLGTTNSAICSFDGENLQLYKSPEQHDVTPSAIFYDRRGNKYVGARAYDSAARNPDNAATLFKRLMGTSTPIRLESVDRIMTPEECSAEVLRAVYGYLPESIRTNEDAGTVITVPAAFNQMQREATMAAAELAGIGRVALMQEPVAAVMSVMRKRRGDGVFVVFDLGGGTLDVAVAESIAGRVSLLAHGGISMCGGRDFDRSLFDQVVKPWLTEHFALPENWITESQYKPLLRTATWATEKAKIQLSQRETAVIALTETELGVRDLKGEEVYLDIHLDRQTYDRIIASRIDEAVKATRETLEKAGLSSQDVERVVFVGGPTQYGPLRDRVAFELGIAASTEVNPMTAVAEGAAVFAESIDWSSRARGRKSARGGLSTGGTLNVSFNYISRTPDRKAKIVAKVSGALPSKAEFQVDSRDTGWSSGRIPLQDGNSVDLPLDKAGDNAFKVFVFDESGAPITLEHDRVVIARTAASVDAIPASHTISVEARDRMGGPSVLAHLVKQGEQLPKKGTLAFKAGESLRAGSTGAIRFKLFEGEITDPIADNRFIGMFEIRGADFEDGVITAGAELNCEYEILDSGNILMEVSVPSIRGSFRSGRNFYSRQEGQIDFSQAAQLVTEQAEQAKKRLGELEERIDDPRLEEAREKLDVSNAVRPGEADPELMKQAMEKVQQARELLAATRKAHLKPIRQMELDRTKSFFDEVIRQYAKQSEESTFDNLTRTAQRAIDESRGDFEVHLDELRGKMFGILWRQDWFITDRFKRLAEDTFLFPNAVEHSQLVSAGHEALRAGDMDKLRNIVAQLDSMRIGTSVDDDIGAAANIVRA
jgi:molecular chaperone DnaK